MKNILVKVIVLVSFIGVLVGCNTNMETNIEVKDSYEKVVVDTLSAVLTVVEKEAGGGFHPMVCLDFPLFPGSNSEAWCYETPALSFISYGKNLKDGSLELRHQYDGGIVITKVIPFRDKVEFVAHVENQTKTPPELNMCWQLRESVNFKAIDEDKYYDLVDREFIFIKDKGRVFLNNTERRLKVGSDSSDWFNQPYSWIQIYKSDMNNTENDNVNNWSDCSEWSNCSPDLFSIPLIGAVSRDKEWMTVIAADSTTMSLCNAWHNCMHIWPQWNNGIWRNTVYVMENNPEKLIEAYNRDFK